MGDIVKQSTILFLLAVVALIGVALDDRTITLIGAGLAALVAAKVVIFR